MSKQTEKGIRDYQLKGFGISFIISLTVPIVVAWVMAILANSAEDSTAMTIPYALISIVASGVISGFINGRLSDMKKAMLASFMVALLMLAFGIIISGGAPGGSAFMNCACFMLTTLTGAYMGKKREKRRIRTRKHRMQSHRFL